MNRTVIQVKMTVAFLSIIGLGVKASSGQDIPVSRSITIAKDIPNVVSRPVTIALDIPTVISRPFTLAFCPAGVDVVGEPDCNDNGALDICEIANCTGVPACDDCNGNGVPDECDIADATSIDCNANDVPDECDISGGTSEDCQPNGIPDECDIEAGTSEDVDANGIPDECCEVNEQVELHASDAAIGDGFGSHVSITGDRMLVAAVGDDCEDGSNLCGAAYVFRLTGSVWLEEARLTADIRQSWDAFGVSVSIAGDRAVVGAARDDDACPEDPDCDSGAAYVFRREGTTWVLEAKLTAEDAAAGDDFARFVSIDGDRVVVGVRFDDDAGTNSGSAYVFRREGTNWVQEAKLTADDAFGGDLFGWSVAIDGGTVIVGARGSDNDGGIPSGAAFVFRWQGTTWLQEDKLLAADGSAGDAFGIAVSIDSDRAIVGAYRDDDACPTDPNCDSGSAYVFRREGTSWLQEAKITASDEAVGDLFSWSVSIRGDRAIVGTRIGAVNDFGSAYVYQHDDRGTPLDPNDDVWVQIAILTASDAALGDLFAWEASISGDWAMVGAERDDDGCLSTDCNTGSLYVFDLSDLCPVCGDGDCTPSEPCTCPADCGAPPLSEVPGSTCADGEDNDCDGNADCDDPDCDDDSTCDGGIIPTVSEWGLVLMALLLLAGAKIKFGRHRPTQA